MRGACSDAAIFRLLNRRMLAIVDSRSRSARPRRRLKSRSAELTSARSSGQLAHEVRQPLRAVGGDLAGPLLRRRADERPRPVERVGRDAEPEVRPQDVGDRHHRLGGDGRKRRRQHLFGRELARGRRTRASTFRACRAGPTSLLLQRDAGRWWVSTTTWSLGSASGARRSVVKRSSACVGVGHGRRLFLECRRAVVRA